MAKDLKESKLFTPYQMGPVTLRNRTIRSAAFESMGKDFNPTQKLKDYHVSVAKGGVGMTTLAYASINRSGVSFNSQLWLRDEVVEPLKDITDAIHAEGAAAGIQIGHCGNMTHWSTAGSFPVSASNGFNLYSPTLHRRMTHEEIRQTAKDFGKAVHLAHESGFDSVEVHAGHGYLISQFLSPWTNRRRDEFGGSLENRMRFMKMCLEEVMEAAYKTNTAVLVKHNMEDGFKSGIQIPESIEIAKEIEKFNRFDLGLCFSCANGRYAWSYPNKDHELLYGLERVVAEDCSRLVRQVDDQGLQVRGVFLLGECKEVPRGFEGSARICRRYRFA